jgi:hypothetical protein
VLVVPVRAFAQAALFDGSAAFPQFFDNNGLELAGGSLSFFASTTSTPQAIYSDATLATPLATCGAGCYTLDGSGRAPVIYLSAVAYKVVLKDSGGSTIATADPVYGAAYLAGLAVAPVVQTITSTGTVNDLALTSTTAPLVILRCNNATDLTLTGFVAGTAGQRVIVQSVGAGNVLLTPQAGSSAANRLINFATVGNTPLFAGVGTAEYVRDGTTARWRLDTHDQGRPITPTFAAGSFTGSGSLTWTVASANTMQYYLRGKILTVFVSVTLTSTGGTASTLLQISNAQWGGFSVQTRLVRVGARTVDAGTGTAGYLSVDNTAPTVVFFVRDSAIANWSNAGAANTSVEGEITFEVQD